MAGWFKDPTAPHFKPEGDLRTRRGWRVAQRRCVNPASELDSSKAAPVVRFLAQWRSGQQLRASSDSSRRRCFSSPHPFSHSVSLPSETEKRQIRTPVLSCFISSVTLLFTVCSDVTNTSDLCRFRQQSREEEEGFPNSNSLILPCTFPSNTRKFCLQPNGGVDDLSDQNSVLTFQMKVVTRGSSPLRVCVFLIRSP